VIRKSEITLFPHVTCGGIMVNYVLLVAVLTVGWVLYAAFRVGPWFAKRSKTWGEVCAFLVFTGIELGILIAFLTAL
jgi:hypothetical protein